MNVTAYFQSLSTELNALKDRVRSFIGNAHGLTDGELKESVLRTIIKRHTPAVVEVGRGFILGKDSCSSQIDILIYDTSKPILYRDGDLVFVTGDAVKGIIEVKSRVDLGELREASKKLAKNTELAYESRGERNSDYLFTGFFSYDTSLHNGRSSDVLAVLKEVAGGNSRRIVNHVCLGNDTFIRYWKNKPRSRPLEKNYNKWHYYTMANLAQGYFINNIIDSIDRGSIRQNRSLWFPIDSKEVRKQNEISLL